jgi:L-fuculose-phosphate aldolase
MPKSTPKPSLAQLRQQVCDIGHRIWLRGMCAGNEGNHSLRLPGNKILCTPSQVSKGFMKPADLAICDMTGHQLSGPKKRTSEINLHLAIYKARPDVGAIVHGHPPHATAFCITGVELPHSIHPEAEVFLGQVATVPYVTPGDHRLGDSVLPYLKHPGTNTLLLGQHGVVTFAPTLEQAYYYFEVVESYARILLAAKQLKAPLKFTPTQVKELLTLKSRFGLKDSRQQ